MVEVTDHTLLEFESDARAFAPDHAVHRSAAGDQKREGAAGQDTWKDSAEIPARRDSYLAYHSNPHCANPRSSASKSYPLTAGRTCYRMNRILSVVGVQRPLDDLGDLVRWRGELVLVGGLAYSQM